jgi:hypothetical protein
MERDFRQNYGARFIALLTTNLGARWGASAIAPLKRESLKRLSNMGVVCLAHEGLTGINFTFLSYLVYDTLFKK